MDVIRAVNALRWCALLLLRSAPPRVVDQRIKWWHGPLYANVNPTVVRLRSRFSPRNDNLIEHGDWDWECTPVCKPVVKELRAGTPLRETSVYSEYAKAIANGDFNSAKGLKTMDQLLNYLRVKEKMVQQVSSGRFMTSIQNGKFITDDVTVYVNRYGEIILANAGAHRLVAAQHAGLTSIPVFIRLVHSSFWDMKEKEAGEGALESIVQHVEGLRV